MPNADREFDRFLEKSRMLTATPPPDRVQQTQKVVKQQIQSTVRKPLYSFLVVLVVVALYLFWKKPSFVTRAVLPTYVGSQMMSSQPIVRRFDYIQWVKASFCLALLIWAVLYLLMGAMTTSSGFNQSEECEDGDEPDSGGYCSG